ncbi:hypothetical protein AGMMS49982_05090 [Bacteroidia bacterium]|nr:hypothetical protein AGMMS49982_05090 [Bacteroidia bacterium]
MKKIFLVTMLAWIACSTAMAQFGGGTGASTDPYLITNKTDWDALADAVNGGTHYYNTYFVLTADLTGGIEITKTIGNDALKPFRGNFDGWGHEVQMANAGGYVPTYSAFGYIGSSGIIKKLGVIGTAGTLGNTDNVGGIAIEVDGGRIENCYSIVSIVTFGTSNGIAKLKSGVISNCYYYKEAEIKGESAYGIGVSTGSTGGTIEKSFAANERITFDAGLGSGKRITEGSAVIDSCYANSGMTINSSPAASDIGLSLQNGQNAALGDFKLVSWFATNLPSWDFATVWRMPSGGGSTLGFPELRKTYCNTAIINGTFTRACDGTTVTYSVPAGTYISYISQADADAQAQAAGQADADYNCTYSNVELSQDFTRNCGSGEFGSTYTYTVPAGTFTSTSSQADADDQALADITANGQIEADLYGTCTPYTYTIHYDGNGHTGGSAPNDSTKVHFVAYTAVGADYNPGNLTNTGYIFSGWHTSSTATAPLTSYTVEADTTLYAVWEPVPPTYTITYLGNGHTGGSAPNDSTKVHNVAYTAVGAGYNPGNLTKTGYTFNGWDTIITATTPLTSYTVNAAATLYAVWVPMTYTITYDGNAHTGGSVPANGTKTHNVPYTAVGLGYNPGYLTKTGYTFNGWHTNSTVTAPLTAYTNDAPATLYAVWILAPPPPPTTYPITYHGNGHTGGSPPNDSTKVHDVAYTAVGVGHNPGNLTKTGYTFNGWDTIITATTPLTSYTDNAAATLYAVWVLDIAPPPPPATYTITYYGNGNTGGSVPANGTKTHNVAYTAVGAGYNPGNLTRTGYTFNGWNTNSSATTPLTSYTGNANATLYAVWVIDDVDVPPPPTYTITYNRNGGSGTMSSQTKTQGVKLRLQQNAFAPPSDHQFDGWATSPTGQVQYADRDSFDIDANTTLYAKWYIPEMSITLNKNIINGVNSLKVGDTEQLIATVLPDNATNKTVIWSSSDDFVVAVDQTGLLTALKAGKAIITATTQRGGKKASCEVTVVERWTLRPPGFSADYDGDETLYISGNGPMPDYDVAANDVPWSSYKNKITRVIVYTGVTTIGSNAFNGLSRLTSVTIPKTVTKFETQAFKGCSSLYSITISERVTEIETSAFEGCDGLQAVYNYSNTPQNLDYAFGGFDAEVYSRATLYVPAGKKSIYQAAREWEQFRNIVEGLLSVTFETNESAGGSFVPNQDVVFGAHLDEPSAPTFYGCKFAGWYYTKEDQEIAWDFDNDTVITTLTLRAKWLRYFQVYFVTNGGTAVEDQTILEGDKVGAFEPQAPVLVGYTFDGWFSDVELLVPWDINTKVVNSNRTLYAKWRLNASPPPSTAIDLINANDADSERTPSVQVYPNPTTGEINILNAKGAEIRLYNTVGILLHRTHETRINLANYPNGIYLLRTGATTVKVVKN